jgi:hypothetical protein
MNLKIALFFILLIALSAVPVNAQTTKQLIVHDMGNDVAHPAYIQQHISYLNTLPIDGLAVYLMSPSGANNYTFGVMNSQPISVAQLNSLLAPAVTPLQNSPNLKNNFLMAYTPNQPIRLHDDAAWAIVLSNVANLAAVAHQHGFKGIFLDNENYHGVFDWKPGGSGCDANSYSLQQCMTKMRERGVQVIQAIQSRFPTCEILVFHSIYTSDRAFFDRHPQYANVNAENELLGPFIAGLAQGNTGLANVINGGEAPPTTSYTEVDNLYKWAKFFIADDSYATAACMDYVNISCGMGPNGFIPAALKGVWSTRVTGSVEVRANDWVDGSGNVNPVLSQVITNALTRADKYAWLYMDVGALPHASLINDPAVDAFHAVTKAFKDAIAAGRAAAAPSVESWVFCANEGGTCSFPGSKDVRYGAGNNWSTRLNQTSPVACNNFVFGDPVPNTAKACYTKAAASVPVAISNIKASSTSESATVTWSTDVGADSQVEYGTTTAYGASSGVVTGLRTTHAATISGLSPATFYHFRVRSTSGAGVTGISGDFTFTTAATSTQAIVGTVFLSDLQPTTAVNGWGPMERDMSNGEQAPGDGQQIRLNGVAYTKGLGVHAPSDVRYAVGVGCSSFHGSVGLDDRVRPYGSVVFQVFGDGLKIFDSGLLKGSSATRNVDIPISGYRELRLVVTDAGDGRNFDHADWGNARMSCSGSAPPVVSATSPAAGATGVSSQISVTATFSTGMQAASISAGAFSLVKTGSTATIAATVTYDATRRTATLSPQGGLEAASTYIVTIKGGVNGVKNTDGVPLAADVVWSFSSEQLPKAPSGTSDLSDLAPTAQNNGWGPVEIDRSNGELAGGDGKAITLNGVTFNKGLGVHATSELRYSLGGNCSSFTAQIGVDDEVGSNGSVVFQVWADGIKLFDSGRLTGASETRAVSVSLAGKSELRLIVTNAGDGDAFDHADWARPILTCK